MPKPRGIGLSEADLYRSARSQRRSERRKQLEEEQQQGIASEEKKPAGKSRAKPAAALQLKKLSAMDASARRQALEKELLPHVQDVPVEPSLCRKVTGLLLDKEDTASILELIENAEALADSVQDILDEINKTAWSAGSDLEAGGEGSTPDFSVGKIAEEQATQQACIWDEPITRELQVELMEILQRITEHFAAAALSIQLSRPFDAVCIVVTGCLAAVADSIVRKRAIDQPAEVSCHLSGKTIAGRQLGHPGYGARHAAQALAVYKRLSAYGASLHDCVRGGHGLQLAAFHAQAAR